MYLQAATAMLACHLLRYHSNFDRRRLPRDKGGLSRNQLRTVTDYMMSHLAADTTLGELASLVRLSESHFSRAFKLATGSPPYKWRMEQRIRFAQDQLRNTSAPIAEIALASGFANQSHFTKAFRDAVGASPAAWRRNWRP